ncbi:MAG: hypothetical protein J1E16_09795 [Muribaculaceae bacterium]|nr:hypothetical protein [Muribaculaceae bacterium]
MIKNSGELSLQDAMLYVLVTEARGLSVPQITYLINRERLHARKDGLPVTEDQVWACYFRNRHTFVWEGGIIHLVM